MNNIKNLTEVVKNAATEAVRSFFRGYEEDLLMKLKNFYLNGTITERGNTTQFWMMILLLIQIHFSDLEAVSEINLNGFIETEKQLQMNPVIVPEAEGVYTFEHRLLHERGLAGEWPRLAPQHCDIWFESTKTIIEQKSTRWRLDHSLQTNNNKKSPARYLYWLSPYHQALEYSCLFPEGEAPHRIVTSNFREIRVYEGRRKDSEVVIPVESIEDHWETLLPLLYEGGKKDVDIQS